MSYGKFTKLHRQTAAATLTFVSNVIEIDGISPTRDTTENTTYGGDSDAREYERGMLEPGELTVKIKYRKTENAEAKAMEDEFYGTVEDNSEATTQYALHYPVVGKPSRIFNGIITSVSEPLAAGEDMVQEFKFKLSGPIERGTWA
tara:strand:- start:12362 stop:12799 length:438 start_codon:yes stop_codon:yes gene_type:complete